MKDWFDIFYKAFSNPDKTNTQLDSYIEAVVRDYCDRFWNDTDAQAMCVAEAKAHGLSSMMYPDAYTRKTISDAYFAELMKIIDSINSKFILSLFMLVLTLFDISEFFLSRFIQTSECESNI